MRWAQRLKRVFNIDIETGRAWYGAMMIMACIEHQVVIEKIPPPAGGAYLGTNRYTAGKSGATG